MLCVNKVKIIAKATLAELEEAVNEFIREVTKVYNVTHSVRPFEDLGRPDVHIATIFYEDVEFTDFDY